MERPRTISTNASFSSSYLKQTDLKTGKDNVDDTEISIFDARKYYFTTDTNLKPNDPSVLSRMSSASSADGYGGRHLRRLSFNAAASTPTASSEASWNSHTGLLSNPPGAAGLKINPPTGPSNSTGRSSLRKWLFCRRCPCTGNKSVQVKSTAKPKIGESFSNNRNSASSDASVLKTVSLEQRASSTNPRPSWGVISGHTRRISAENHQFPTTQTLIVAPPITAVPVPLKEPAASAFTFPILDNPPPKPIFRLPPLKTANSSSTGGEEPPRNSLEVFRPKEEYVVAAPPQRRNSRPSFTFPGSPNSRTGIAEDDIGSDASSDLFEIESFSTSQATTTTNCPNLYPPYPRRDSLDEAAVFQKCSAMTEGYEPSEGSVEWSVTTAEGFAPAASEMAEEAKGWRRAATGNGLSCRCEKAVSVGPRPQPLALPSPPPPTSSVRHVTFAHHKPHHSANAFSVSGAH